MRILFLSHYFPPEGNAPASRTYENCKRWVAAGHEVTVITCAPNVPEGVVYKGYKNTIRPQHETVDGIDLVRVWTYIAPNSGTVRRIANYLSFMFSAIWFALWLRKPDIVLATSPQFFNGWAGVWVSRFRRIPFILEIRDIWPESITAVGAMQNPRLVRFLEWLEARMYRAADHIVTVGDGYRKRLHEKGVADCRMSVVMNGVDRQRFSPCEPEAALRKEFGLSDRFVCSYIGTIGMACGLDVVLQAAEQLKKEDDESIVFLLVGDGAVRSSLEEQARKRGLDNIIFTGRRPKEQIPGFLSITDACFVHLRKTSLFQTVMPSKIFEAAGMARPIINAVEGFAARIVDKAGAGINIPPEEPAALIAALNLLRDHPDKANQFAQSGYQYVTQYFDRDILARDYLQVIKTTKHQKH